MGIIGTSNNNNNQQQDQFMVTETPLNIRVIVAQSVAKQILPDSAKLSSSKNA
jgi:hypothetical protein